MANLIFDNLVIVGNDDDLSDGILAQVRPSVESSVEVKVESLVLNPVMTNIINNITPDSSHRIQIPNACFTHLSGSFGRGAFDGRDIFASDNSTDDSSTNVFSHRTRVKISKVHVVSNHTLEVESIRNYDITNPLVARVLAKDSSRKVILDFLSDGDMVRSLAAMLIGGSNSAEMSTKRFSFTRLLTWVRHRGLRTALEHEAIVATIILREILNQFDWEFETITPMHVNELQSRLAILDELRDFYVEGWISRIVPNTSAWLVVYSGGKKVTSASLEEVLSSSIVRLRRLLMEVALLNNRSADVINAAKIAAAINLGLIESIPNETLLAFVKSSAVVNEMAEWYCIVESVLSDNYTVNFDLGTHVGDVSLLNSFANEFVDAVNNNPLIKVLDVGSFLKHLSIKHFSTDSLNGNLRYHTSIYGNLDSGVSPKHYIESELANNIYGLDVIRENNGFNDDVKRSISTCYAKAIDYLSERDAIVTYGTLSLFVDPEDVITSGKHGFTLAGVCARDIRLLALVSSEVLIRYTRVIDVKAGTNILNVVNAPYVIDNISSSTANPLPSFENQVYTHSSVIACCFNVGERMGTGSSPLLEVTLDLDKVDFLFNPLGSSLGQVHSRLLPPGISLQLNLPDASGSAIHATTNIDLRRYLVMSSVDETHALVPHSTVAQLNVVDYALNLASARVQFRGTSTQYAYDMERINASYLAAFYDSSITNIILRNMATNVRHDVARQLVGTVSSFTTAYNSAELRVHTTLMCAMIPFSLYLGDIQSKVGITTLGTSDALILAYNNNRLFRDAILSKILSSK